MMWQVVDRYPRKGFAIRRITTGEIADIFFTKAQAEQRCAYLNNGRTPYEYQDNTQQKVAPQDSKIV